MYEQVLHPLPQFDRYSTGSAHSSLELLAPGKDFVPEPPSLHQQMVLIVEPDPDRAAALGASLEQCGATWSHQHHVHPRTTSASSESRHHTVFITEAAIQAHLQSRTHSLRRYFDDELVLVGIVRTTSADIPALFGAGFDLIIYDPPARADLERALVFSDSIRNESPEQARDRLRKMTALQGLAINAGRQIGATGWFERMIEAGRRVLQVDAVAMWSLDLENRKLHCLGSSGLPDSYVEVAEQSSPELVDDYVSLPEEYPSHWMTLEHIEGPFRIVAPDAAREAGIRAIAWVPVRDVNRLYGHLSFYFMSDWSPQAYDLVLADAYASIVASSLGMHALQAEIHRSNRLYREHVEASPNCVLVCLPDGSIERVNAAITDIAGWDRFEALGRPVFELFLNPDRIPWDEWLTLETDVSSDTIELWTVKPSGERRRVSAYARRLMLPHTVAVDDMEDRIQLVLADITEQARRLVELQLFHDLTQLISDHGSIDEAYELVASRLYGYLNYRLVSIGEVVDGFLLVSRAYRTHGVTLDMPGYFDATMGICGRAVRENRSILVRDVTQSPDYVSIDDAVVSELVSIIRVDGHPVGLIDIQADETQPLDEGDLQLVDSIAAHLGLLIEQVTIQERLERQALTDPLTGMSNRRAFMQAMNDLVTDPSSPPAGLLLVELDHFKVINDRYGHLFGDEMLKQVGIRLQSVLRSGDTLARYGGDEIAIIFRNLASDRAFEVAERLRSAISDEPFVYDGQQANLTVSVGIALFPLHGRTTDELIGEADRAMYAAKLEGRNSVYGDFLGTDPSPS